MEPPHETLPPFRSSAFDALNRVVQSPNWVANVLWLTLAGLTSGVFIGHIALLGYGADILGFRAGRPENPPHDINPDRLGDYITRGLWPFLVSFVVQTVLSMVLFAPLGMLIALGTAFAAALSCRNRPSPAI